MAVLWTQKAVLVFFYLFNYFKMILVLDINVVRRRISRIYRNSREKAETESSDRLHSGWPAALLNQDKAKQTDVLLTTGSRVTM